ncbi:hypothetical protein TVAG_037550 [Trichomonas vaginalis G3]|uniref:NET domain-containing protein n=1 Tax=Trichomonas vaginalis (strain ATCC PRA-98 / G3) TaxID=412133 RepID=A2FCW2_TRIV3|nr:hypothetical protein TVAGG3_0418340 [Trichomonas vaginalis G3]EAX97248.1 hypothetical protein TVAG_037550 [Trichomonas vaginalis G3]KAI5535857.1 hypothetical protein TVAGG3_0418340 [Trichomonas vaginalis G3]|eukprot:XP_001310178.1 hypothetical protein [Trichomonas vaginalis G3]
MDPFLRTQCLNIFEDELKTPLGCAVIESLKSYGENVYMAFPIEKLRQNLEKNVYNSVDSFASDIKNSVKNSTRLFGAETEESLGLQTICHNILQNLSHLSNSGSGSILDSLEKISLILEGVLSDISDSHEEFINKIHTKMAKPTIRRDNTNVDISIFAENEIDLSELHEILKNPPTDKAIVDIVDILMHYELNYSSKDDELTIDLSNCEPYTVALLKKYVQENSLTPDPTDVKKENKSSE